MASWSKVLRPTDQVTTCDLYIDTRSQLRFLPLFNLITTRGFDLLTVRPQPFRGVSQQRVHNTKELPFERFLTGNTPYT
jgi:hypothetical protein